MSSLHPQLSIGTDEGLANVFSISPTLYSPRWSDPGSSRPRGGDEESEGREARKLPPDCLVMACRHALQTWPEFKAEFLSWVFTWVLQRPLITGSLPFVLLAQVKAPLFWPLAYAFLSSEELAVPSALFWHGVQASTQPIGEGKDNPISRPQEASMYPEPQQTLRAKTPQKDARPVVPAPISPP